MLARLIDEQLAMVTGTRVSGSTAALGLLVTGEFRRTGLVPRLHSCVLATMLVLLSLLSTVCGLILDSVTRGRKEIKRLSYLAIPGLAVEPTTFLAQLGGKSQVHVATRIIETLDSSRRRADEFGGAA
jgi:hypothetical protein